MKFLRLALLALLTFPLVPALSAATAGADSQRTPSDDAYADGQAGQEDLAHDNDRLAIASVSFPAAEPLTITYLKFDVGHSGTLSKATLWLYAIAVTGAEHAMGVYAVADDGWKESSLTWNNQPGLGDRLATSPASTGWLIFDVSSYVSAQAASDGVASFGLAVEPPYDFVVDVLEDRENTGSTGKQPYLVLETSAADGVSSFSAEPKLDRIELAWTTSSEDGISGFNLYRGLQPDARDSAVVLKLNPDLIQAKGSPT